MLENRRLNSPSAGDFDQIEDKRAEIDTIQFLSLSKMIPRTTTSTSVRIALRFEESFRGKPLLEKLRFVYRALRWGFAETYRRSIGKRGLPKRSPAQSQTLRVAVHGTGSIGDFLTHMLFIQTFYKTYGPMEVDFFCHEKKIDEAKFVFANTPFIKNIITVNVLGQLKQEYDLIVHLRYLVKYEIINHSRILGSNPELFNVIEIADKRYEPYDYVFNQHPHLDGLFARHVALQRMNLADITGYLGNINVNRETIPYFAPNISEGDAWTKHGLKGKDYITIHHGFDTSYIPLGSSVTKCWPLEHWNEFVRLFKARFPDIMVVQIGTHHSGRIEGVDLSLVSRTTLGEAAWIIKHALLHIDGESGLVRMARALHTTSIVLFGPTSSSFFSFRRNINIVSAACSDCWWSSKDWMSSCPRGLKVPECMQSIEPEQVVDAAAGYLANLSPALLELVSAALYDLPGICGQHAAILADLFNSLQLPPVSIQEHSQNDEHGIYLKSAQQWECMAAWDALEKIGHSDTGPLNIADIGGCRGAFPAYLAKHGHRVTVIDQGYSATDPLVEKRFMTWSAKNNVDLEFGSVLNIPAENETYDVVLLTSALNGIPHKTSALREAIRVLKPGGHLVFTFELMSERQDDDHDHSLKLPPDRLTPERLKTCVADLGLRLSGFSAADVENSQRQIKNDRILDISDGSTRGAIVIKKLSRLFALI